MNPFQKLSRIVEEASEKDIIPKDLSDSIKSFCESANENDPADISVANNIIDNMIENVQNDLDKEDNIETNLRLAIFESARYGEITNEQRDYLFSIIDEKRHANEI